MIYSVDVVNSKGESILLELSSPETTGMAIANIDGLSPGEATINTTSMAIVDGDIYDSSRISKRNIVFSILFQGDGSETIEQLRHKSYKYFNLKDKIKMTFKTEERLCYIEGYVESNVPTIFAKNVSSQISVICPNPFFKSIENFIAKFNGSMAAFQFPFSNESLTEKKIQLSIMSINRYNDIVYNGDAESGVEISLYFKGSQYSDITIYNRSNNQYMKILVDKIAQIMEGAGLQSGDLIKIITYQGKKAMTILRDGETTNCIQALDSSSDWITLTVGHNEVLYNAATGANDIVMQLTYEKNYNGV